MAFSFKNIFSTIKETPTANKSVVGFDFGSTSVKVVEIEQRDDVLALSTYGELQLGPYSGLQLGMPASQLDERKKTEILVDVIRESGVTAPLGVLALPLTSSFVTLISINAKKDEDISSRIRVEARKYIPVPITDVILDWTELAPLPGTPASVREVLVAAIQNDIFSQMNRVIEAVQSKAQPAEIELFSALRSVSKSSDTSVGVIDFGAQSSKLYIAQDGMLRKIHRVRAGGVHATERIAELLSIPFEEAENLKRNYTTDGPHAEEIKKVIIATFERPLQEFKRVIQQYQMRTNKPISRLVIIGGSAAFHEMQEYVSYMLDASVERANPFTKVAYPAFMEDVLIDIAPTFSVALGAALRPFELTK